MSSRISVGSSSVVSLVPKGQTARVTNTASSGTLYVGTSAASSASYKYTIAAGASRIVPGPAFGIGSATVIAHVQTNPVAAQYVDANTRWHVGGPAAVNTGTSTTPTANTAYLGQVTIGQKCVLTGIRFAVGATGGTAKATVVLYDSTGKVLAYSLAAGTTVGTSDTYQAIDFTEKFVCDTPGQYFLGVGYNGNTASLELSDASAGAFGATSVIGGSSASAFDFSAAPVNVTAPTTVGAVPFIHTY